MELSDFSESRVGGVDKIQGEEKAHEIHTYIHTYCNTYIHTYEMLHRRIFVPTSAWPLSARPERNISRHTFV